MPEKETLGGLAVNHRTIGRQVASDDNADKRQRNCKYWRAALTEG